MTEGLLVAVINGPDKTETETVPVFVQEPNNPVTVYIVDDAGETVIDVPVKPPGFQV